MNVVSSLYAGQYFQNFIGFSAGSTNFNDGSALFSTALGAVACLTNSPYNELQLTESGDTNVQSAFELPDLDSGAPIYAFSVKWNSEIYGSFPAAGDGFSFNFGSLSSLNLITNNAEETGYGVGLCFSVQTDAGTKSGFYMLANGTVIASLTNNPSVEWGTNNTTRHFWEVDWNYYSGMSVRLDGEPIFTNVATTGFVPEGGDVFAWGARCSTNTEEVRLDNIVAVTGGNLVQLQTGSPYFADENLPILTRYPITNAFYGNNSNFWATSGSSGYAGATVAPPNCLLAYALTSGAEGEDAPQTWTMEGSTNSGASWDSCGTGSGYFLNSEETRCWLATNTISYTAYEINFTSNGMSAKGDNPPGATTTIGELRFYALSLVGAPYARWKETSAPALSWMSIASSSDGSKLAAASFLPQQDIYVSTNSGTNWTLTSAPDEEWESIASSANGTILAAASYSGAIYVSTNSGSTWSNADAPHLAWYAIACSSDGTKLAAAALETEDAPGDIYTSTNSGAAWTLTTAPDEEWRTIASSSNGTVLVAGYSPGVIYVSTNSGITWSDSNAPSGNFNSIVCSSDGTKMAAANAGAAIYVSTNSGATWTNCNAPNESWHGIASSSDGTRLAAAYNNGIVVSTDGGGSWINAGAPIAGSEWQSIASSSDGTKLAAVLQNGGIYTYGFGMPPSPSLEATYSASYPVLSWSITNGGNFVLQASTNILSTNWLNVPCPVTTNSSSYQITDLPTTAEKFYRLMAQ